MTLEQLEQEKPLTISVPIASKIMGVTPLFLRHALMQNKFQFGIGVEMGRDEFYINTVRFLNYMKGQ